MCKVVSGMFSLGGEGGDGLAGKGYSSKLWWDTSEAQKPALRGYAGSLMADLQGVLCGCLGC